MATQGKVPRFIQKLADMLGNDDHVDILAWCSDGQGICIYDSAALSSILPLYFRHNKPCSFVRQLNIYGFRKFGHQDDLCFTNDFFHRDAPERWVEIKRRVSSKRTPSDPSHPSTTRVETQKRTKGDDDFPSEEEMGAKEEDLSLGDPTKGAFEMERDLLWGEINRLREKNRQLLLHNQHVGTLIDQFLDASSADATQLALDRLVELRRGASQNPLQQTLEMAIPLISSEGEAMTEMLWPYVEAAELADVDGNHLTSLLQNSKI